MTEKESQWLVFEIFLSEKCNNGGDFKSKKARRGGEIRFEERDFRWRFFSGVVTKRKRNKAFRV